MMNDLEFTIRGEEQFYDVVDMKSFRDEDAMSIFNHLNNNMQLIPFCDYLKRYIYKKIGMQGDFNSIDINEYRYIIAESFAENYTPKSFTETSAKMSVLTKNWLTQTSVSRQVIFLLGFGLNMSDEDVSKFLVHAQRERSFNFKDPFEIICWFCYRNNYKYPDFVRLMEIYKKLPMNVKFQDYESTIGIRDIFIPVRTEQELMQKLADIKTENQGYTFSVTARKYFNSLYMKTREIIANKYNEDARESVEEKIQLYYNQLSNSDRLSYEEKAMRAQKMRQSIRYYNANDITTADVEKFLCCGIPFDGKGNLLKLSKSSLAKHFNNKRMSRKHLNDILSGKTDIDRFDLITLNFFIHAMNESETNNKRRYINFIDSTNQMLSNCLMGELYVANPYECFLMMCILSDWPMGAYADVLERSFGIE